MILEKHIKNYQIQFLRGIGCLVIVFYHFFCRYKQIYYNDYGQPFLAKKLGIIGVYLFLVLTGYYLIPRKQISPVKYLKKRLKSIYPSYLISIIVIFLLSLCGYLGANREVSFIVFIQNVFMINGFINTPYVDGAHWYMTYIVVFITMMSLIICTKNENNKNIYISWILINLVLYMLTKIIKNPILQEIVLLSGGTYAPLIVIGISVRNLKDCKFTIKEFMIINLLSYLSIFLTSGIFNCLVTIILTYIVWNAINNKIKYLNKFSLIVKIGDISYIIYLIHQNIGYMIMNYLNRNWGFHFIICIIISSIIILILSYIIKFIIVKLFSIENINKIQTFTKNFI